MYNRYIPQPDGSYRKTRMQTSPPPQQHPAAKPCPPPEPCPPPVPEPCAEPPVRHTSPASSCRESKDSGIGSFLRQLLPRDFDTSDLMIVLLLLLMAGDRSEDQSNALLTLALYLFL